MSPKVVATPAQKKLLDLIATEGVHRLCFKNERPTGVTLTWCWVGARSYTPVKDSTINACIKRGWVTLTKGSLKPETPPGASGLYIAMNNLREPDTLSLTSI